MWTTGILLFATLYPQPGNPVNNPGKTIPSEEIPKKIIQNQYDK
jgi:hypothetical protein